jgi:hypothetical protein
VYVRAPGFGSPYSAVAKECGATKDTPRGELQRSRRKSPRSLKAPRSEVFACHLQAPHLPLTTSAPITVQRPLASTHVPSLARDRPVQSSLRPSSSVSQLILIHTLLHPLPPFLSGFLRPALSGPGPPSSHPAAGPLRAPRFPTPLTGCWVGGVGKRAAPGSVRGRYSGVGQGHSEPALVTPLFGPLFTPLFGPLFRGGVKSGQ